MRCAQRLYENGYITYMRTDSTTLSRVGDRRRPRAGARALRRRLRARPTPRQYTRKVKNAQEAHEAIRPAGETFRTPGAGGPRGRRRRLPALRADLAAHGRLADGRRARHHGQRADQRAPPAPARQCTFAASGRTITFPGFLKAYVETVDDQARRRGRRRRVAAAGADPGPGRSTAVELQPDGPHHQPARRATPSPAWSRRWRTWASGGRPPTRRSSRRSRTAGTCGRRAARWCRPGSRSR